jgi:single-strand DNA-binding protein
MSDTYVTLHGWVGTDVEYREVRGIPVANLRVASTPRIKRRGEWMDGDTTWYSVTAWRGLADNVRDSVHKGDAVIVHGRLRTEHWKREDGIISSSFVVDANIVGHDMSRGTSSFVKNARTERAEGDVHDEVADMIHREVDVEEVDPWSTDTPQERPADSAREEPAA